MTAKDDKARALGVLMEELTRIAETRHYLNNPRLAFQPIATELLALREEVARLRAEGDGANDLLTQPSCVDLESPVVTDSELCQNVLKIRSALQAAIDALERVEWGGPCRVCGRFKRHGHHADCCVGIALARLRSLTENKG